MKTLLLAVTVDDKLRLPQHCLVSGLSVWGGSAFPAFFLLLGTSASLQWAVLEF